MLIDYHAHVNFSAFKNDADEVIKRSLDGGVFMILIGSQIKTSRRAVEMAKKYEQGVWAAVGLHPIHLEETSVDEEESHFVTRKEEFDPEAYHALTRSKKVAAIGECGLDYWHLADNLRASVIASGMKQSHGIATSPAAPRDDNWVVAAKQRQYATFRQHLDLASELDLPVIMHCRGSMEDSEDAYRDILEILREYMAVGKLQRRGSIHCFMASLEIAQEFIKLGFYVGFTGVITFPKTVKYAETISTLPLERILVETDCPYLAPVPYRGKRNEPLYVRYVAEKVAEIRGMSLKDMEQILFENTLRAFPKI